MKTCQGRKQMLIAKKARNNAEFLEISPISLYLNTDVMRYIAICTSRVATSEQDYPKNKHRGHHPHLQQSLFCHLTCILPSRRRYCLLICSFLLSLWVSIHTRFIQRSRSTEHACQDLTHPPMSSWYATTRLWHRLCASDCTCRRWLLGASGSSQLWSDSLRSGFWLLD
jgi:hypothetical protein